MLACQNPKKKRQEAVKVFRDGREVCTDTAAGRREYIRRTVMMFCRQGAKCSICGQYMMPDEATFEHQDGRGHGGGHRDDRIEIDGKPYNSAAHGLCNVLKGSVRLEKFKEKAA